MKGRRVWALAGVLLVVGGLLTFSPASAKKTPVDFWEVSCRVLDGVVFPTPDGVLHFRGGVSESVLYEEGDPAAIVGRDTVVGNLDLWDPIGFNGGAFGVFTLIYMPTPGSPTGTYDGPFTGSVDAGAFSGTALGKGTGDLRHQKMRLRLETEPAPQWLIDFLSIPGNAPPCAEPSYFHATGFINHPNR